MPNITTRNTGKHKRGKRKFSGIKLQELPDLERLYEVNIFVYSLESTKPHGEEENEAREDDDTKPEIGAQLLHRSLCHYPSTLYLNLLQRHFSCIKDMNEYAKSYCCSRCGKFLKHVVKSNRQEKTCEEKVDYTFPGGSYKTTPTIFQLLEDKGFTVPEHLKYFPYRATFWLWMYVQLYHRSGEYKETHLQRQAYTAECQRMLQCPRGRSTQVFCDWWKFEPTCQRDGGLPCENQ